MAMNPAAAPLYAALEMSSKYDRYWESKATELAGLIESAAAGRQGELDILDIRPLGDRASWYGRVSVRGSEVVGGSMAHARSLGRTVARLGLCERHREKGFVFTITSALSLKVTVEETRAASEGPKRPTMAAASRTYLPDRSASEGHVDPSEACGRVHALLERLPLLSSPEEVPFTDGLYFFYEEAERSGHGIGSRVVRVGNHPRADHRLKGRLDDHYNYRNRPDAKNWSVFRRYLGGGLLRREDPSSPCLAPEPGRGHWERQDVPSCPACAPYEQSVNALLRERFRFRCVRADDREERNRFESLLIATIAACDECEPSEGWLGPYCYSETVQRSGLWNRHHVGKPTMTWRDLVRFQELVTQTPGFGVAQDLAKTLLLIPCSGGKKGAPDPGLPAKSVSDFLGSEANSELEEGRLEAFRRPGVSLAEDSPLRPALAYYSGQPYKTSEFRDLLIEALRKGLQLPDHLGRLRRPEAGGVNPQVQGASPEPDASGVETETPLHPAGLRFEERDQAGLRGLLGGLRGSGA
jgi:hypothetical protein